MKEKIIIISNYYPPEIGAAANRIQNMAEGLQKLGKEVTVICPFPNYPQGKILEPYKKKIYKREFINYLEIRRYCIFPSNSNKIFIRFLSMISFACSLWLSFFYLLKKNRIFL